MPVAPAGVQIDDELDEQNARAVVRRYLRRAGALIAAMEATTDEQRLRLLTQAVSVARAAVNGAERLRDVIDRRLTEKETLPPQADTPPLCGCVGACRHRRY